MFEPTIKDHQTFKESLKPEREKPKQMNKNLEETDHTRGKKKPSKTIDILAFLERQKKYTQETRTEQ